MLGWHQARERLSTSAYVPHSVCEKGTDLVVQELATCPLTQDLLQEDVRKSMPSTRPSPPPGPSPCQPGSQAFS